MLHFFSGIACVVLTCLFAYFALFFRKLVPGKVKMCNHCTPRILLYVCRVIYIGYIFLAYQNFINMGH